MSGQGGPGDDGGRLYAYNYGRVPDDLLFGKASDRACRLYAILTRYAQQRDRAFPGRRRLAENLGCSVATLDRAILELGEAGFLLVKERKRQDGGRSTNDYILVETPSSPMRTGGVVTREEGPSSPVSRPLEVEEGEVEEPNPAVAQARPGPSPNVLTVFAAWQESTGRHQAKLDPRRQRLIARALGYGYPVEELAEAVQGWKASPHHRGENDRHTVYNDLELILRNTETIERFIAFHRGEGLAPAVTAPPTPKPPEPHRDHDHGAPCPTRCRHRNCPLDCGQCAGEQPARPDLKVVGE